MSASRNNISALEWLTMGTASLMLAVAAWRGWAPLDMTEVLGFISGGVCVWLVVRENHWNWPIGIANNIFFFILFLRGRLFADMSLQVIYFALGIWGWLQWLYGGEQHTELRISRTRPWEWAAILLFIPAGTALLRPILIHANDAAPFLDALTTILSLAAQYLLCQKRLENWLFWILADLIYIPLYFSRHLPLTGILYAIFLAMCLTGAVQWYTTWRQATRPAPLPVKMEPA